MVKSIHFYKISINTYKLQLINFMYVYIFIKRCYAFNLSKIFTLLTYTHLFSLSDYININILCKEFKLAYQCLDSFFHHYLILTNIITLTDS
jgi:hypothetical protein